jgi:RNA polymerase sigma-70 factor, ECF subfamily
MFRQELTTYLQAEQQRIYRLAYGYTLNEQDALDVVQSSMVKALSASTMREPRYLKTWVYRIVANTAIDFVRARGKLILSEDWTFAEEEGYVQESVDWDVQETLARLPADLKTIVVLRFFHELQLHEIADVLHMNLNTVKTRLYRALRLLRAEMEEEGEPSNGTAQESVRGDPHPARARQHGGSALSPAQAASSHLEEPGCGG